MRVECSPVRIPRLAALAALLLLGASDAGFAAPPDSAPRGAGLWGTVRANGAVAPGAQVLLWRGVSYPDSMATSEQVRRELGILDLLASDASPIATTTCDARGDFAFRYLEAGNYVVEARGPDATCALSPLTHVEPGTFGAVPLLLGPVGSVTGRALAADGSAFHGHVLLHPAHAETPLPHVAPRWAATGPDGAFLLERVPVGRWRVFAGRGGVRWEGVADVEVKVGGAGGGGGATVEARMPARGPRIVRVLDGAGKPVAGARAIAIRGESSIAGGTTGPDGRLSVEGASAVETTLTVLAPGRMPVDVNTGAGADEALVRLTPASASGRVRGRVLTGDGSPVAGVAVRIMEGGDAFLVPKSAPVVSGPDGTFVVEDVEPGPAWIQALGAGVASPRLSGASEPPQGAELFDVPVGGEACVDARTVPAASVTGVVVDGDGAPVAAALVRWRTTSDTAQHDVEDAPPTEAAVLTGADGTFTIRSIAARTEVDVRASAPGFVDGAGAARIGKAAGKVLPLRIALSPARWVTVEVRRGDEAATGAVLEAAPAARGSWAVDLQARVVAGPSGIVVLGPLPRTPLVVRVSHHDATQVVTRTIPRDEDGPIRVALDPGLPIEGRVTDAAGAALAGAFVRAVARGGGFRMATTDSDGGFRFEGFTPGEWSLSVSKGSAKADLVVVAGSRGVRLKLRGDAAVPEGIEVRVVGHDGGPVARARIRWGLAGRGSGDGYVAEGRAGIDELSTADGVAGLTIEVTAATDAQGTALPYGPARYGPLRADERRVEIRLPPGRPIFGRVVGPAGADVSGIEVIAQGTSALTKDSMDVGASKAGPDGSFLIGSGGEEEVALSGRRRGRRESLGLVDPVRAQPGGPGVTLVLVAREDVAVTMVDAQGAPADGYVVDVARTGTGEPERQRVRTQPTGEAQLVGLVPGATYELRIADGNRNDVLVIPRWTPLGGTIRLPAPRLLRGVVRDDRGDPFPGAFVLLKVGGELAGYGLAGTDGAFEIPVLTEAPFHVEAVPPFDPFNNGFVDPGLGSGEVSARVGEPVTLVVQRGIYARFRLDTLDRGPWQAASLVLTRAREPWDPDAPTGRVELPAVGAGALPPLVGGASYRLFLSVGTTGRCALASFTATAGAEVVLVPVPAGGIRGRVRWPATATGARILAQGEGYTVAGDCAADGAFVLEGLPPGLPVTLVATARIGAGTWTARTAARPGDEVVLEAAASPPAPSLPTGPR